MGSRDQTLRVESLRQLAQRLEITDTRESFVTDVAFVAQVEIPVAPRLQRGDDGLNGPAMGFQGQQTRWPGDAVPTRERDIHGHAAPVAFRDELFQSLNSRRNRAAFAIHGRRVCPESRPIGPDAYPVDAEPLHVIQIAPDEFLPGRERAVIAHAAKERGFSIERKT
jgi:hypothetical protein